MQDIDRGDTVEKVVNRMQLDQFGRTFEGARLSRATLPEGVPEKVIAWLKEGKGFLVFIGSPGVGKTYFCAAVLAWIYGKFPSQRYWDERRFFDRIFLAMNSGQSTTFTVNNYLDDHFLIYDDLGSQDISEWKVSMTFNIVDNRYCSNLPTIFTSNLNSKKILEKYGERIWDRLFDKRNLIIDMHGFKSKRQN